MDPSNDQYYRTDFHLYPATNDRYDKNKLNNEQPIGKTKINKSINLSIN